MFTSAEQEEYFSELLETEISALSKRTYFLRQANYLFTISTLILSAALTVMLGYNFERQADVIWAKNTALIIGAGITLLSGLKAFWKLETYWVRRKITLKRLEELRDEFNFMRLAAQEFDLALLFDKYQSIQNYATVYWEDIYNEAKPSKHREQPGSKDIEKK